MFNEVKNNNKLINLTLIFLLISIILGIILRIYNLNYENLWNDEIFTFWITDPSISVKETYLRVNQIESIPFLHYLLLKNFHSIFGYAPEIGRYFSAFCGILSIFTIGYLCKLLNKNRSYLLVIYLVSLNIFLISYSQEARVYIFSFLLASIYLIYYFKVHKSQSRNILNLNFILFNLLQILTFLSFPFTTIIYVTILIYTVYEFVFFKSKSFQIVISLIISGIFLLIYIPYYIKTVPLAVNWLNQPDLKFYTDFYFTKFFGSRIMGLVHLVVLIGLIINFHKEIFFKKNNYFFFTLNIFLFYFIPIIYGWISQPAIHERYIIFVTIPLLILISSLIFEIKSSKIKYLYIIIFVVITFANHFTENTFKQFYKITERYKPNFVEVYKYINSTEIKNIYFDLSNLKTEESEIIFSAYSNYSNYLFNSNDFDIQILDKIDNSNNFDGFWSICLFGEEWCNFNNNKYEVSNTKKFFKLHIKLYLKKS